MLRPATVEFGFASDLIPAKAGGFAKFWPGKGHLLFPVSAGLSGEFGPRLVLMFLGLRQVHAVAIGSKVIVVGKLTEGGVMLFVMSLKLRFVEIELGVGAAIISHPKSRRYGGLGSAIGARWSMSKALFGKARLL